MDVGKQSVQVHAVHPHELLPPRDLRVEKISRPMIHRGQRRIRGRDGLPPPSSAKALGKLRGKT